MNCERDDLMFTVPEAARITPEMSVEMGSDASIGKNGAFLLASPEPGWALFLICSDGEDEDAEGDLADWEHVSVSARALGLKIKTRIPTWKEMCVVKARCWDPEDVVVQYHPRASRSLNQHPHVLHLWRWKRGVFPTPPPLAVGLKEATP